MASRSAAVFNKEIRSHSVFVPNKPPDYVTEYKENFKWPPRSAYVIKHTPKPPALGRPLPDLASIGSELKVVAEKVGADIKPFKKVTFAGPPVFSAPKWKKLKKIADKILDSGYEKPLISRAKKAMKSKTVNKELRGVAIQLRGALLEADFQNARNGKPLHPPMVLKYFRAFVDVVKSLEESK